MVDKVLPTAKMPKRKLRLSDLMEFTAGVINPNLNLLNNYFVCFYSSRIFLSSNHSQAYPNNGLCVLGIHRWDPSWNCLGKCSLCWDRSGLELESTCIK